MEDNLYGPSLFDQKVKDPFKYRGRGRPRKIDYITIREAQEKYSQILNHYLNLKIK